MHKTESIGRELKILHNKIYRCSEAFIPPNLKQDVTEMQGQVIGFLYHNQDRDLFQRDVEAEFSITRATASKMLTLMEKNRLITRSGVAGDARLKKLELTEKANYHAQEIHRCMIQFEKVLTRGLTGEEKKMLLALLQKIEQNVEP